MPEIEKQFKEFIAISVDVNDDERTVTAAISTGVVDRDKEVMLPKGALFDNFIKNPIVLWAHSHSDTPIGKAQWIKRQGGRIIAKTKFAMTQKAQEVYDLFKGGFLKAFSIGFIPIESRQPTAEDLKANPEWAEVRRIISKWELLEYSAVPIPANPEALALAVKNKEIKLSPETTKELDLEEIFIAEITNDEKACCPIIGLLTGKTFMELMDAGCEELTKSDCEKPFPAEHSCRLNSPDKYDRFARKNCEQKHGGKCIDVIYGIKDNKAEIQALRFPKDVWEAEAAKSVCSNRGGSFEAAAGQERDAGIIVFEPDIEISEISIDISECVSVKDIVKTEIARHRGKMFGD